MDDEQEETKPSVSSSNGELFSNMQTPIKTSSTRIHPCNNNNNDDDDDEIGLIKSSPNFYHSKNSLSTSNGLITTSNLLDGANSNLFQMHLAQIMASTINANSPYPDTNNHPMINTLANIQKNLFMQYFNDSTGATQAVTSTPVKSNNKHTSSGRKRKSTPEKRAISNHPLPINNNGDVGFLFKS